MGRRRVRARSESGRAPARRSTATIIIAFTTLAELNRSVRFNPRSRPCWSRTANATVPWRVRANRCAADAGRAGQLA